MRTAKRLNQRGLPIFPEESCVILEFSTPEQEAKYIATFIGSAISESALTPRDFAILVKQKSSQYTSELSPTFYESGVRLRDESEIQEYLAERLVSVIISFLRLGSQERAGKHWVGMQ